MSTDSSKTGTRAEGVARRAAFGRLLATAGAILLLAIVGDQLLALGLRSPAQPGIDAMRDAAGLHEALAAAASEPGRSVLLIGDSVLAGDVLASRSDAWQSQRVLDHLRSERHSDDDVGFRQAAADALLPVDIERIVAALDRVDPDARVEFVVEISLRYFSRQYREGVACTRAWLCEMPGLGGPGLAGEELAGEKTAQGSAWRRFVEGLRSRLPLLRHQRRLRASEHVPTLDEAIEARRPASRDDPLLKLARIEEHFRVDPSEASAQRDALLRILSDLDRTGRKALFFATPMRDGFSDRIQTPSALATMYAEIAAFVHDHGGASVRFVSLDHPLFRDAHFIDHAHLTATGSRLLALNLLLELGVRLDHPPAETHVAYDHTIDRTIVSGADRELVNGPGWSARIAGSGGVAFDPTRHQLVIADSQGHAVRRMRAGLRSLEPWAGQAGERGEEDGRLGAARFASPRQPVIVAEHVYLLDGHGARLRRIAADRVETLAADIEPKLRALASDRTRLLALDVKGAVYEWREGRLVLRIEAPRDATQLQSIAVSSEGEVFVADARRIWRGRLGAAARTGAGAGQGANAPLAFESLEPVITSRGERNLPKPGERFPMPFAGFGFTRISALAVVERYGGLLVSDEVQLGPGGEPGRASERMHLRYLDLASRQVFPWLTPLAASEAYFPKIHEARHRASSFHASHWALDPTTADLYLLEKGRSRVIRIADGLQATARIADHAGSGRSPFGDRSQRETISRLHPERHREARVLEHGWRGALFGLHVGTSSIVMADQHGYYQLVRSLERELDRQMGPVDRVEVDVYGLSIPKADVPRLVDAAIQFMTLHFVPDFVLVDTNELLAESRPALRDGRALEALAELERLAQRHGFELVVVDGSGLGAVGRDGLRPRTAAYRQLFEALRQASIPVIEPTPQLLEAHRAIAPWGNPPYRAGKHHGSPQAIDRTARELASQLAPMLAEHFESRVREGAPAPLVDASRGRGGLHQRVIDHGRAPFDRSSPVPDEAVQVEIREGRLEVVVDIGRLEALGVELPASEVGVRSLVRSFVLDDARGRFVDEMRARFVRFANYDEYGQGTLEGAHVEFEAIVDPQSLARFD